jgi:hypothetical protein
MRRNEQVEYGSDAWNRGSQEKCRPPGEYLSLLSSGWLGTIDRFIAAGNHPIITFFDAKKGPYHYEPFRAKENCYMEATIALPKSEQLSSVAPSI